MKEIKNYLVCGAGMMGCAIAQILAELEGTQVTIYSRSEKDVKAICKKNMELLVKKGVKTEEEVENIANKIAFTTDMQHEGVKSAQFVIECVAEVMEVKQDLFVKLEEVVADDCIFCTNTSVMSPTEISAKCQHKERICGTHFWNPAFLIPLVEVVKTADTSDEVIDTVMKVLTDAGKKPVLCKKDVPGFIANRMQHALWREAISIVENGIADAKTVDDACKYSFGLRLPYLPPLVNSDMVGTQLTNNIHSYVLKHLEDSHDVSPLVTQMLEEGKLGFKAEVKDGKREGFMSYTDEEIAEINAGLNEYLIKMIYNK